MLDAREGFSSFVSARCPLPFGTPFFCFCFWIVPRIVLDDCCCVTLLLFRCHSLQDLQDRMKKEAKREMDERTVLQRDEAAAAKEDEEFKVCCCRIRARSARARALHLLPAVPFLFGRAVGRHDLGRELSASLTNSPFPGGAD